MSITYPIVDAGPRSFNVWKNNDNPGRVMQIVGGDQTAYPDRYWQLDKSTNRHNPKDESGWRSPSDWHVSLQQYSRAGGRLKWFPYPDDLSVMCDDSGPDWPELKLMPASPGHDPGLRQLAEVRALLKLKDMKLNLPQAFAEREQTVALVASSITRVAKMFKAMKHGNLNAFFGKPGGRTRALRPSQISDAWLELQYGWQPLLSDCYGAVSALSGENDREGPRRYRYHVIGKVREDYRSVDREYTRNNQLVAATEHTNTMHMCKVRLDYEPDVTAPFQNLVQAGITNPLELAWELLPYSFVVDWALPVGNWLSTFDAAIGWKFLGGSCTEVTRMRQVTEYRRGPSSLAILAAGTHLGHRFDLDRSVYTSSPIPRPPVPKNPASLLHLNNAMALLLSTFGRGHHVSQ